MNKQEQNKIHQFMSDTEQYWERMFHIALSMLNSKEAAEDAVQEVLIKSALKQDQFQEKSKVYTWLVRILINHCHDENRKKNRLKVKYVDKHQETDLMSTIEDKRENIEENFELSYASKRLNNEIQNLELVYKEVVLLKYFEKKDFKTIATMLNISIGTAKARLSKAKLILLNKLKKLNIEKEHFGL